MVRVAAVYERVIHSYKRAVSFEGRGVVAQGKRCTLHKNRPSADTLFI